jgi:hypothetical protein
LSGPTWRGLPAWSISQPWAWATVHEPGPASLGYPKNVENRSWCSTFRGRFLVHACARMTLDQHYRARSFVQRVFGVAAAGEVPWLGDDRLRLGGIIGSVELVDVIAPNVRSPAGPYPWHMADFWGHVLANPVALPFFRCKGLQRNFFGRFDVVDGVVCEAK